MPKDWVKVNYAMDGFKVLREGEHVASVNADGQPVFDTHYKRKYTVAVLSFLKKLREEEARPAEKPPEEPGDPMTAWRQMRKKVSESEQYHREKRKKTHDYE